MHAQTHCCNLKINNNLKKNDILIMKYSANLFNIKIELGALYKIHLFQIIINYSNFKFNLDNSCKK